MTSVLDFKANLNGKLHGTTLNKIVGNLGKLGEAASVLLLRIDPATTIRSSRIENAIYSHVTNYAVPDDLKGIDSIIDIRPIGPRSRYDEIGGRFDREFDIRKERNTFAIEYINGVKTLRLSKCLRPRVVIAELDSADAPGATITLSGDASNLATDDLDYVAGFGSVSFDLSGATGTGIVEIALTNTIDLTTLLNLSAFFEWIKFPGTLTSLDLRWGANSSNYWHKTVTHPHDRSAFDNNAWNLLLHDWNGATKVGSPSEAAIGYLRVTFTYPMSTPVTGVHLDNITAALGEAWEMLYYSNCLFKGVDGTYKTVPTLDSDIILLDPDALAILGYETLEILAQEVKGKNGSSDIQYAQSKMLGIYGGVKSVDGLYDRYTDRYPSQAVQLESTYHDFSNLDGS